MSPYGTFPESIEIDGKKYRVVSAFDAANIAESRQDEGTYFVLATRQYFGEDGSDQR